MQMKSAKNRNYVFVGINLCRNTYENDIDFDIRSFINYLKRRSGSFFEIFCCDVFLHTTFIQ